MTQLNFTLPDNILWVYWSSLLLFSQAEIVDESSIPASKIFQVEITHMKADLCLGFWQHLNNYYKQDH